MKHALWASVLFALSACDTGGQVDYVNAPLSGKDKKDHKVLICHHAGPHDHVVAISVDASAVPYHVTNHGDFLAPASGECGDNESPCTDADPVPCETPDGVICCPPNWTCETVNGQVFCSD